MAVEFTPILEFLSRETGLCSASGCNANVLDGVRRAMERAGLSSAEEFLERVRSDESAFDELLAEVTVGETYFFREPEQFRVLREVIVPEIADRMGSDHVVRLWSAGCASGEEAWSLAIACHRAGFGDRCHIRATDVSREALQQAEQGTYRKWSFRGPAAEHAQAWISERGSGWQVHDELRRHVTFDYLNLALDCYPSLATGTLGCDVIFCRNVLIYFDAETTREVTRRLYDSLSPGGWLILASTDPPLKDFAPFDPVETGSGIVYRRPLEVRSFSASPPPVVTEPTHPPLSSIFEDVTGEAVTSDSTLLTSEDVAIKEAQAALDDGDYSRVRTLTEKRGDNAVACALLVRALTCVDASEAEAVCATAVQQHSTVGELHYLHAVLLLELERHVEAEQAVRRTLFLDRRLAVGHFSLGVILQRSGDTQGARRAFRNACDLCAALPAETVLPLTDGEPAGRLLQMAKQHLAMLGNSASS